MRLAYLDPHAVPDTVPEALQILQTVDALGTIGVDVLLVTPYPRRPLPVHEVLMRQPSPRVVMRHLTDFRRRWWFPVNSNSPFFMIAARVLARAGVDAVLVRNLKMAEYLLRHRPEIPLIFETHEVFAQSFREEASPQTARRQRKLAALEARERYVYENAKGLVALTPLLLEDIRRLYGADTRATVAPDAVDLNVAARASKQTLTNSPAVLLYLGSLHPWKGVEVAVQAMALLKHPARLIIVGGNERRIGELRELAHRLGIGDRVSLTGPCPPADRFAIIGSADICLLPLAPTSIGSRYTSPLKLFEYLAMEKPVVASDLPSIRLVLRHDRDGLLAESGSPHAFAQAIDRLLEDPALRRRLGAAGRERASAYSWEHRATRIRDFIHSLLSTPPGTVEYGNIAP